MFPSSVPRVFVLAGLALLTLVFGTSYYLYDDEPSYYYPPTNPQPAYLEETVSDAISTGVNEHINKNLPGTVPGQDTAEEVLDLDDVHNAGNSALKDVIDVIATEPLPPTPPPAPESVPLTPVLEPPVQPPTTGSDNSDDPRPPPTPGQCIQELDFLRQSQPQLKLSDRVSYSRRCIQPVFSGSNRTEVGNISDSLFGHQILVNIEQCQDVRLPRCVPIRLPVSKPYPRKKYPHFIFGIATDYTRLAGSLDGFAHWLSNTDSKLVAVVTDMHMHNSTQINNLKLDFQHAGVDVVFEKPFDAKHSTSQSHFMVLVHMLALGDAASAPTRWYGLLDDDTFYPSLHPLDDALSALDHNRDFYVGTLSEDFNAIRNFGFMAFGGAGAYISAPLARKLGANAAACVERPTEGDIILRDCVYRHSKAKLTMLPGLYQQDMKGDASGFFESGVQALNFHHWKSWFKAPVVKMAATANYCGDCLMQRWRFGVDEVLANGYSIAKYRDGLETLDLDRMEGTWEQASHNFDFSIGPFRQRLGPELKKSYRLEEAKIEESRAGGLRQLYVHRGNHSSGEFDEVVELVWGT